MNRARIGRVMTAWVALWVALNLAAAAGAADLADPTQPPPGYGASQRADDPQSANSAPTLEPVQLQMIARDGSQRLAVVNGHRVRAGDAITLDGKAAKVMAIHDDSIVLDRDGRHQKVELSPQVRPQ
jgi:hypothetical protein